MVVSLDEPPTCPSHPKLDSRNLGPPNTTRAPFWTRRFFGLGERVSCATKQERTICCHNEPSGLFWISFFPGTASIFVMDSMSFLTRFWMAAETLPTREAGWGSFSTSGKFSFFSTSLVCSPLSEDTSSSSCSGSSASPSPGPEERPRLFVEGTPKISYRHVKDQSFLTVSGKVLLSSLSSTGANEGSTPRVFTSTVFLTPPFSSWSSISWIMLRRVRLNNQG